MVNKHTRRPEFIAKGDPHDVGVPMRPAPPGWTHQGVEDALDPGPKRGDYTGRIAGGPSVQLEAFLPPDAPYGTVPTIRAVDQRARAANLVVDDPGGPLDVADPHYETLKAQREKGRA